MMRYTLHVLYQLIDTKEYNHNFFHLWRTAIHLRLAAVVTLEIPFSPKARLLQERSTSIVSFSTRPMVISAADSER